MRVIVLMTWREGLGGDAIAEAMAKRATWSYPTGSTIAEEYWPAGNHHGVPAVIAVYDELSVAAMMELTLAWNAYFDISFVPAMTATEGLQAGADIMSRLAPAA